MADAARLARGGIADHMPVVGSDGQPVGTVDRVEGQFLKLTRQGAGGHHWVPRTTVAGLEGGVVRLSMPAGQVTDAALDEAEVRRRLSLDPDAGAAFGKPDDSLPHGSRAHAHGGPKGQREHGQSGQASGPPGDNLARRASEGLMR